MLFHFICVFALKIYAKTFDIFLHTLPHFEIYRWYFTWRLLSLHTPTITSYFLSLERAYFTSLGHIHGHSILHEYRRIFTFNKFAIYIPARITHWHLFCVFLMHITTIQDIAAVFALACRTLFIKSVTYRLTIDLITFLGFDITYIVRWHYLLFDFVINTADVTVKFPLSKFPLSKCKS